MGSTPTTGTKYRPLSLTPGQRTLHLINNTVKCKYCNKEYVQPGHCKNHEHMCRQNPARKQPAQRKKTYCSGCERNIQNRYLVTHRCKKKPERSLVCAFCLREFETYNGCNTHMRVCNDNPNRCSPPMLGKKGANQAIKARSEGRVYSMPHETRKKISVTNSNRTWSDERKQQHSDIMKAVVSNHPESYTSSNRGRVREIIIDGIKCQGQWEVDFYLWCKETGILVERCDRWFEYNWKGIRKYNPDFYLPEHDLYVEIKGYETERDREKWKVVSNLVVIKEREIKLIRDKFNGPLTQLVE